MILLEGGWMEGPLLHFVTFCDDPINIISLNRALETSHRHGALHSRDGVL